ncbi:MAG: hypothetical protein VX438_17685, partial [Planctomycetota bacterium]|nr:hypothetical protein [Planctomycetota bacterium]
LDRSFETRKPNAEYYYWKAVSDLKMKKNSDARVHFDKAIDADICPLRMTSALRAELKAVADNAKKNFGSLGFAYIDLQEKCLKISPNHLVEKVLLVDHVHPSISTHKRIATWIIQQLQTDYGIARPLSWETEFNTRANQYQQSLGYAYYQRGKDRLLSVLKWSRGEAVNPLKN